MAYYATRDPPGVDGGEMGLIVERFSFGTPDGSGYKRKGLSMTPPYLFKKKKREKQVIEPAVVSGPARGHRSCPSSPRQWASLTT